MTLFGGMPYDTNQISYLLLLSWLMLLVIGDCASGIPAARLLLRPRGFVLIRAGWRRWFRLALRSCCLSTLVVCVILLIPALLHCPGSQTLLAWLLFTLHMEAVAAVQVLLMALFEKATSAMTPVVLVQFASVLSSQRFSGASALLLPGNWGSLARTKEYEHQNLFEILSQRSVAQSLSREHFREFVSANTHGGFPLWAAFALNIAVILLIALFGWRLVRRKRL